MFSKVFFFVFALLAASVEGFSTGAQGCAGDGAAVGGAHLDTSNGKVVTKLPFGNVKVFFGAKEIALEGTSNVPPETSTEIKVEGTNIKGVLFRYSHADGTDMSPFVVFGQNTKRANVCIAPVTGITHTSAIEKPLVSSKVSFPKKDGYRLDLTIVYFNNDDKSDYTHGVFTINANCDIICPARGFRRFLCRVFGTGGKDPCVGI